jgi:hypothetical protein
MIAFVAGVIKNLFAFFVRKGSTVSVSMKWLHIRPRHVGTRAERNDFGAFSFVFVPMILNS